MKTGLRSGESGFTIIQLLVALGLLGLVIAGYARWKSHQFYAGKILKMNIKIDDVVDSIIGDISLRISDKAKGLNSACSSKSFNDLFASIQIGPDSSDVMRSTGEFRKTNLKSGARKYNYIKDAVERCRKSNRKVPTNFNSSSQNSLYVCFQRKTNSDSQGDSFLDVRYSLVEVRIEMVDVNTGNPVSCNTYRSGPPSGAKVYYSIYWENKYKDSIIYKRRNGVFHVSQ